MCLVYIFEIKFAPVSWTNYESKKVPQRPSNDKVAHAEA